MCILIHFKHGTLRYITIVITLLTKLNVYKRKNVLKSQTLPYILAYPFVDVWATTPVPIVKKQSQ